MALECLVAELRKVGEMVASALWRASTVRYVLAGGTAFVFNVVLLNLFREFLGWPTSVAAMTAFWATLGFSYAIQRVFAFGSQASVAGSLLRYSILVAFNSIVVSVVVTVSHEYVGLGLGTSQLIATGMTTIWNYFVYKHWVYASSRRQSTDQALSAEVK